MQRSYLSSLRSALSSLTAKRAIRRALPLALVGAMLLAPVPPAAAEIIDFDPQNQEPAEILEAEERALLATLANTNFAYVTVEPSPSGRWAMVWSGGEEGLMDLSSGETVELPEDTPGFVFDPSTRIDSAMKTVWLGDDELGLMARAMYVPASEEDPPTYEYYRVSIDLSGDDPVVDSTELTALADMTDNIMDISPDLNSMLIMRPPVGGNEFMPDPISVTLGESPYERALPEGLPTNLPGRIDANPLGTLEVQQASFELVLKPVDGGEAIVLDLSGDTGDSVANVTFSPDGSSVSMITRSMPGWDGDRQRDNDPPGQGLPNLSTINVREALGLVAPEENPLLTGTFLHVFDTADGSVRKAFANTDLPQGMIAGFAYSPSSERAMLAIATRSELDGREHPTYAYPGGVELHILDSELNIVQQVECPGCDSQSTGAGFIDDDTLVMITPHNLDTQILHYDIATGDSTTLWDAPGSMFQAFARPGGMIYSHSTIDRPMELYAYGDPSASGDPSALEGASPRPLTRMNSAAAEASEITFNEFTWQSSDGATLSGIVVHHISQAWPPTEAWPMVVWQQGGPGGQMVNDWGGSVESPYSLLPNIGIPVFIANAAGRTSGSPQFFTDMAEGTNFGQLDIAQIKEGVEQMIAEGMVDAERVGVTGCSYGGYFTLQSIRTYPDFYAAANPQCSLVDLIEEFNFGYTPFISYLMGRTPFMEPAEYLADSPMFGTNQVSTPTLIFHGTDDFLPVPLINNIHDQLVENGTDVTFLRVEGEGHGFGRFPNSQPQAVQMQVEFFREQLGLGDFERPERTTVFLPAVMNDYEAPMAEEGGN